MKNIRLTIEYDGTNYNGWQKQASGKTIQQEIENAIFKITNETTPLHGSGRTDSGVHALAQVANFKTASNLTTLQFQRALNRNLPYDISITEVNEVPGSFHSQYNSKSKIYLYKVLNRQYRSAHVRNKAWHIKQPLNLQNMDLAVKYTVGTHDFKVFSHSDSGVKSTIRTVKKVKIIGKNDMIIFEIEADGFLKRMVRLIIGTLVQVGKGRIDQRDFQNIMHSGKKTNFIHSAPPHGLFLKKVKY